MVSEKFFAAAEAVFAADIQAVIYPWSEKEKKKRSGLRYSGVNLLKNMPATALRSTYMSRGFAWAERTSFSFGIHLGTQLELNNFKKKLTTQFRELGMEVYNHSPHERTICIGWLKCTTRATDCEQLAQCIAIDTNVECELRFRPINEGRFVESQDLVRAVHIEIPSAYGRND